MSTENRILHLELECRRLKRRIGIGVVLVLLGVALGQARPKEPQEVKAMKFTVVDDEGQ